MHCLRNKDVVVVVVVVFLLLLLLLLMMMLLLLDLIKLKSYSQEFGNF